MTCVLVIGTPRSGSSCVAGILHHLGIRMSLGEYPAPTPINPAGFFEDAELSFLLAGYVRGDVSERRGERLRIAIAERCKAGVPWGCKTHGLAYCLPLWLAVCPVPVRIIRTMRPVGESERSAEKAFGRSGHVQVIAKQIDNALAAVALPMLTVEYGELLDDPMAGVARIASFLDVPSTLDAAAFVQPALRTVY